MIKRILFFCAVLAFLFLSAARALADDPNRLSQLSISVWPEYDTSTVLVILDGTFADTSSSSRQVSVLIPSRAKLHAATFANADGTLAKEQPTQLSDLGDGYARVTFSVSASNFWLEYYDDALQGNPDKTLDFSLKAPAPADQVKLEVQQPLKATNFSISPATPNTRSENGFTYFDSSIANVTTGQVISAQIKYTKTDPNPSVSPATAPASVPTTPVTTTSSSWGNTFLIVAIVVLGLTAVLGLFMLQQQRSRRPAPIAKNSRNGRRGSRGGQPASLADVFCTQCGRPLGRDDNFCPKCGAKRKVV